MSSGIKSWINKAVNAFEQGELQEFSLSFLPIYNEKYEGFIRHGGTAQGKTRKGVPDLIKHSEDLSSQIAVEISTDEKYWKKPQKGDLKKWKPCSDLLSCLNELDNPVEIVLISNQEIPTNLPNAKSEISKFAKRNTDADITIFSLADIENQLYEDSEKYSSVFEKHLPEIFPFLFGDIQKPQFDSLVLETYKKSSYSMDKIEEIVQHLAPEVLIESNAIELVLDKLSVLSSRYERKDLSNNLTINRQHNYKYFENGLIGNNLSLIGVPKIGKSTFIAQVCLELQNKGIDILWFDTPISKLEHEDFISDFKRITIGKITNYQTGNDFAEKRISFNELLELSSTADLNRKFLIVIDDFQLLDSNISKEIELLMNFTKASHLTKYMGVLIISNKSVKKNIVSIDKEYLCPAWDKNELFDLLKQKENKNNNISKEYCELLEIKSGGHPLVALALSRKYPTLTELFDTSKTKTPELHDVDLTREMKELMFDDLLSDNDDLNLVLRLSILIFKHDISLIEFVAKEIDPSITKPTKRIIETLRGTIIEGEEANGYQVAFLFKALASTYVSNQEKIDIIGKVIDYLFERKDNVYNGLNWIYGITYCLAINNLDKAIPHSMHGVFFLYSQEVDHRVIRFTLERLEILELIDPPTNERLRDSYLYLLVLMSLTYKKIDSGNKANSLLFKVCSILYTNRSSITGNLSKQISTFASIQLVYNLALEEKYDEILSFLGICDPNSFISDYPNNDIALLDIINVAISRTNVDKFPTKFLSGLINNIQISIHENRIAYIIACFQGLSVKLSKEKTKTRNRIMEELSEFSSNSLWTLCVNVTDAQLNLELKNYIPSINQANQILENSKQITNQSRIIEARILALKAEAYYMNNDKTNAEIFFMSCVQKLESESEEDIFNYAWSNYRLGLSTADNDLALSAFSISSRCFEQTFYVGLKARSDGEKAIICFLNNNAPEAVSIFNTLVDKYYLENVTDYAPAVTIALGLLTRFIYEKKNEKLPAPDENYPKFTRGIFDKVVDYAEPNPSIISAKYVLIEAYKILEDGPNQERICKEALGLDHLTSIDIKSSELILFNYIELLVQSKSFPEIEKVITDFLKKYYKASDKSDTLFIDYLISQAEVLFKDGDLEYDDYQKLIECLENSILLFEEKDRNYCLAAIYRKKAGVNTLDSKDMYDKSLLRKSWEYGLKGDNYRVLIEIGHIISFDFCSEIPTSLKELAEMHLSILLGINCFEDTREKKHENLKNLGDNIYILWSKLQYNHSNEKDYPYIINLKHRAQTLAENNVPEELYAPVMILNLITIFGVADDSNYQISKDWSQLQLKGKIEELSNDQKEYLKDSLDQLN